MSAFSDALVRGPWYLQAAGGGYLSASTQADPTGAPYVSTAPLRGSASQFAFTVSSAPTPSTVQATLTEVGTGRVATIDAQGALVLGPPATTGAVFTASQRRSAILSLQWTAGAAGANNVVYAPAQNQFATGAAPATSLLLAINPPAGSQLWSRQMGAAVVGAPATFGGSQVVSGSTPFLTCFEAFTGRLLWEYGDTIQGTSPAVVNWSARAAVAGAGSTVYAVSIDTAQPLWTFAASSAVYARPRAAAGQIFVSASYGVLHALAADTGVQQWRFPASGTLGGLYTTAALSGDQVVFGAWDGSIYALDINTGVQAWSYPAGDKVNGVVLATDQAIFVGNDAGAVAALNPATGAELWVAATDGIVQSRPALSGGQLIVATALGSIYAFDAVCGAQAWTINVGAPVVSDIAVSDGIAYFTTTVGQVCAVTLTGSATPPTWSCVNLGAPSAGSVNAFSGAVNAATTSGQVVSTAFGLRTDINPLDLQMLLQASDLANRVTPGVAPPLPPGWTLAGVSTASNTLAYATALVFTARRPSDDGLVTVVAFGVQSTPFLNNYDPASAALISLPAVIGGSAVPASVTVTDSVLDNYLTMRSAVLALIAPSASVSVMVTGQGQGGALAALAAVDYAIPKTDTPALGHLTNVTFGAPPPGGAAFATLYAGSVPSSARVVVAGDATLTSLPTGWVQPAGSLTLGQGFPSLGGPGSVGLYAQALLGRV